MNAVVQWAPATTYDATLAKIHWKSTMASKSFKVAAAAAAAVVAIAAYWYWSPFLAARQLQTAAQSRDAAAFNKRVDYPKVRESIKRDFSAMFEDNLAKSGSDNAIARAGAAFGARLGGVMVNRFVDAVVRPEMMMRAIQSGQLSPVRDKPPSEPVQTDNTAGSQPDIGPVKSKPTWTYEREGLDKVVLYAMQAEETNTSGGKKSGLGLVLQRSGFANWKLTEVRLPKRE